MTVRKNARTNLELIVRRCLRNGPEFENMDPVPFPLTPHAWKALGDALRATKEDQT